MVHGIAAGNTLGRVRAKALGTHIRGEKTLSQDLDSWLGLAVGAWPAASEVGGIIWLGAQTACN